LLGAAIPQEREVIGVFKAYTTVVGAGPFPTDDTGEWGDSIRQKGKEYGATTGRPRRCGALDIPLLRHAIRLNGVTSLALTKMDILTGLDKIKICVAYRNSNLTFGEISAIQTFDKALNPAYIELDGWQDDITLCKKLPDMSENARNFVLNLEKLLGVKISIVSTGPNRDQTILR